MENVLNLEKYKNISREEKINFLCKDCEHVSDDLNKLDDDVLTMLYTVAIKNNISTPLFI